MKKRMAVWGGKLFQGVSYDRNKKEFKFISNNCLSELSKKNNYEVDNFSMGNLSSAKAVSYLKKALNFSKDYDYLIIELGEIDSDLKELANNLGTMIELANENNIKPILVNIPTVFNTLINPLVNKTIKEVSYEYSVMLIDVVSIISPKNELNMYNNPAIDAVIYRKISKNIARQLNHN